MRKRRLYLTLALAVVFGVIAFRSAVTFLQDRAAGLMSQQSRTETAPVVVAARDVGLGELLAESDVRVVDWPVGSIPEGYAGSPAQVVGRGLLDEIRMNEPVLDRKLADAALGAGLPPLIPTGMRALAVKVDEVIGVAGFVTPQTRVDIILTMVPPGSNQATSKVILQNIRALAADQEIQRNEEGEPIISTVVTVLVTLEDAERLVLASSQGLIQMALRNTLDLEMSETSGQCVSALFTSGTTRLASGPRVPSQATPASRPSVIEMYQGGVRTLISY